MKSISIIAIIALVASVATPKAEADDTTRALVGGLIGGIVIGKVISDHHADHRSNVEVVYTSHYRERSHHRERGHYEWVTVKRWVPGYYATEYDRRGRGYRVWVPGHHVYEKEKVWVSHGRSSRPVPCPTSVTVIRHR